MQVGRTVQPASEATGPSFLLMEPPALKRAMSTPLKLQTRCQFVDAEAMMHRTHCVLWDGI